MGFHSTTRERTWRRRKITRQAVAIAMASAFAACEDSPVRPLAAPPTATTAALVPGEYWEVLTITATDSGAGAEDINSAGVIVGYQVDDAGNVSRAFRYQAGSLTLFPTTPGTQMTGRGINASGQITGSVMINGVWNAYVRHANGTLVLLPHYGSASTHNFTSGINDLGEVAGFTDGLQGVRWSPVVGGWTASSIGVVLNYPEMRVHDINNSGWIVGSVSENVTHTSLAYVKRPGQGMQFIPPLGGVNGSNTAWSINNSGKVLGGSTTASGEPRLFSWTSFGGTINEAATTSWAASSAISDKGRIAGVDTINGRQRAFTIYQGIRNVLPFVPNGHSAQVYAVNSCGIIVGRIQTNAGINHAVRWRRVVGKPPLGICD